MVHVVHRDINPKNILLRSFKKLHDSVLIADFGLGAELSDYNKESTSERCGTVIYMAPEQLKGNKYTTVACYAHNKIGCGYMGNWYNNVHAGNWQASNIFR